MFVTAKNLPLGTVFFKYNGTQCNVIKDFHSREFGTSLRIKTHDDFEFTLSSYQYETDEDTSIEYINKCRQVQKPFVGNGLRSIQRFSAKCVT